jgi:hypothetical protein
LVLKAFFFTLCLLPTIGFSQKVQVISNLEVLDLAGRSVFKQYPNSSVTVLSTLTMAKGDYLLKINLSNGQNEVRRISVLH